jgi:LacI family transcriptional regulator
MIKILLVIDYSSEFSRRLMRGLIKYSKENGPFIFYRLPSYYKTLYGKDGIVEWAKERKADAIIALWDHEKTNRLKQLNIPVLLQNYKERSNFYSNITGDYFGTGEMAAKFFIQRKFKNFAFYGNKGVVWSRERAHGFKSEVERNGGKYFYFESENLRGGEWTESHVLLDKWLLSLPKPVAIFACDDNFALQVSEICKMNHIKIPQDVSLLGVDNDDLICNLSDPPISSIVLDVEKGGFEAGRLIHQLIKKEKTDPFNIIINPTRIELRQSTELYNIEDDYIEKVVKHIVKRFNKEISIDDLSEIVPLSRRNLEIRFKNEMGTSIYQFILELRINHFSNLLLSTDRSLFDLALESGFNDCKNISRIFKKFKGATPVEFREKWKDGVQV